MTLWTHGLGPSGIGRVIPGMDGPWSLNFLVNLPLLVMPQLRPPVRCKCFHCTDHALPQEFTYLAFSPTQTAHRACWWLCALHMLFSLPEMPFKPFLTWEHLPLLQDQGQCHFLSETGHSWLHWGLFLFLLWPTEPHDLCLSLPPASEAPDKGLQLVSLSQRLSQWVAPSRSCCMHVWMSEISLFSSHRVLDYLTH